MQKQELEGKYVAFRQAHNMSSCQWHQSQDTGGDRREGQRCRASQKPCLLGEAHNTPSSSSSGQKESHWWLHCRLRVKVRGQMCPARHFLSSQELSQKWIKTQCMTFLFLDPCGSSFIFKDFLRWKASRLLICKTEVLLEQTRLCLVIPNQTLCTLASLCAGTEAKSNIIVLFQNLAAFLLLECGP